METKPVRFIPHAADSPEIRARISEGHDAFIRWRTERINQRAQPLFERAKATLQTLVDLERVPFAIRIPAFWRAVETLFAVNPPDVACKRGCSHCCHICVLITQDEADVIGARIGRKPERLKAGQGHQSAANFHASYDTPCTFLVNGECSIYDNRPLACRTQYSVDTDALLCELNGEGEDYTPYLNPMPFTMAFLQMLGVPDRVPVLGDIRDFFPKVEQ